MLYLLRYFITATTRTGILRLELILPEPSLGLWLGALYSRSLGYSRDSFDLFLPFPHLFKPDLNFLVYSPQFGCCLPSRSLNQYYGAPLPDLLKMAVCLLRAGLFVQSCCSQSCPPAGEVILTRFLCTRAFSVLSGAW